MSKVLSDVFSILRLSNANELKSNFVDENYLDVCTSIQNSILCDEIHIDLNGARKWDLGNFCGQIEGVFKYVDIPEESNKQDNSKYYRDVDGAQIIFLGRTEHYIECANKLNLYLALHPLRSQYLRQKIAFDSPKYAAATAVEYLDKKMGESTSAEYTGVDFSVPPVADYVLSYCANKNVDLITAINEIRNSKNAKNFRKWCAEVDNMLISGRRGRAATVGMQKLVREIDSVSNSWAVDIETFVKYVPREISLRRIWGVGSILESIGLNSININDPVVLKAKPHLLFLNDLYRRVA